MMLSVMIVCGDDVISRSKEHDCKRMNTVRFQKPKNVSLYGQLLLAYNTQLHKLIAG